MNFIEYEADEETHVELLEECRDIGGPEEMPDYDLFTAGGYALMGTAPIYQELEEIESSEVSLDMFVKKRRYS